MTAAGIEWADPPETPFDRRSRNKITDRNRAFADALRANPGRWAVWKRGGSSFEASNIRTGKNEAFQPAGAFDCTSHRVKGSTTYKYDLYVRYVGDEEARA